MSTIPEIPEDIVEIHKGYYVCVYVILKFKTEEKIDNKEEHMELENDSDEEEKDKIISMTRGSVTGEMFSRKMKTVRMRRHCYMLSLGIYISTRRKNL